VKRHLDIAPLIPEISDGMAAAVSYGTARSLRVNFQRRRDSGKNWDLLQGRYPLWLVLASYAKTDVGRIVVVVFLQGGRPPSAPRPRNFPGACIANLYDHDFFVAHPTLPTDTAEREAGGQHAQ